MSAAAASLARPREALERNEVHEEPACDRSTAQTLNDNLLPFFLLSHRPECRDTSGTFAALRARTFKSSLEKVHIITKEDLNVKPRGLHVLICLGQEPSKLDEAVQRSNISKQAFSELPFASFIK